MKQDAGMQHLRLSRQITTHTSLWLHVLEANAVLAALVYNVPLA
jgi:hypothetical protein